MKFKKPIRDPMRFRKVSKFSRIALVLKEEDWIDVKVKKDT